MLIALPDALHAEQTLACVIAAHRAAVGDGVPLVHQGCMRRFDPDYVAQMIEVDSGVHGHPVMVHSVGRGVTTGPGATDESVIFKRRAILGTEWIAEKFVEALQRSTAQQIVAVGSRSLDRAQVFADHHGIAHAYGSYEQFVASDVDVVYVAAVHLDHLAHAILGIEAGKPVLVEKPMAPRLAGSPRYRQRLDAGLTEFPLRPLDRTLETVALLGQVRALIGDPLEPGRADRPR